MLCALCSVFLQVRRPAWSKDFVKKEISDTYRVMWFQEAVSPP